jgi:hypothetical protein
MSLFTRTGALFLTACTLASGCGGSGLPSAIDCYAELPEDIKDRPSKDWRATPTRPGPVIDSTAVTEQLQVANVRRPGETETLFADVSEDWVGIAYDPSKADPTSPSKDWNPDYVFDVSFSDGKPTGFSDYGDHFEPDNGTMVWALVDRIGVDIDLTELSMVIADSRCDRLVPSANGEFIVALDVPESGE